MNYDSTKVCDVGVSSSEIRHFFINSCSFSATNFDNIERLENYEFDGVNYESVYEINLENSNSEFEKIVIAKDIGFLFFTINGVTRKAI